MVRVRFGLGITHLMLQAMVGLSRCADLGEKHTNLSELLWNLSASGSCPDLSH